MYTALYLRTGDKRYLTAAEALADKLPQVRQTTQQAFSAIREACYLPPAAE